ncbi:DUF2827 domain-containing protein [Polymorphobacter sp. PAMC 29334]|uniref:DUF2827 family protein n=1 Tax=Polymorphobacter sp. PAMC 29334 TaxID=2862331 RepID=UPI001C676E0A|nr:DUF2827 family protein [Polymorphobacter sp. PAMC 29334]QYE36156.1 DUF2827 domain-containing protein [Polymorphobacter sp. PAMC 29334]
MSGPGGRKAGTHAAISARAGGYAIGITIFINKDGELGLYENGLRQNVVFLYQLFAAAPGCRRVHLLNHGDGEFVGWPPDLGMDGVPVVRTATVADDLDVIVIIGASIEADELKALRARGIRVVGYKGGNGAVISLEAITASPVRGDAERYFDIDCYDVLWMTPQHLHTYAGWCRTLYRVPVEPVPQVWAPTFIDNRAVKLGDRFGYRPAAAGWRIGIMEPNITVMKTSHMAMLVCEAAWRGEPDAVREVYVSNTAKHREQPHFLSFASALRATKAGVMSFEPRFVSADFLANYCDAVVTHHWQNGLNYLYYEVLHGGYPLVHNSEFLRDYGYYYPDFAADVGGEVLLAAFHSHDANLAAYRAANAGLVTRLAPDEPVNVGLHERLVEQVLAAPPRN